MFPTQQLASLAARKSAPHKPQKPMEEDPGHRDRLWQQYFGATDVEGAQNDGSDRKTAKRRRANTQGDDAESLELKIARLEKQLDQAYSFIARSGIGLSTLAFPGKWFADNA